MEENLIAKRIQSSRKDLLDLGLRNSLINFKSNARALPIIDEMSIEILRILYFQKKSMTFAAVSKSMFSKVGNIEADSESQNEDYLSQTLEAVDWTKVITSSETAPDEIAKRHKDTKLQTSMTEERLLIRLLKIASEAETYIQEQGVNILYLALGFLHWYEDDSSQLKRKAPLILIPVKLTRTGARETYKLEYTGEDLVENLSLSAKLKTEFELNFPETDLDCSEGDVADKVGSFFTSLSKLIEKQKRWTIEENEIQLGFFSFGKFLMFKDLAPDAWPKEKSPCEHPFLQRLLSDDYTPEPSLISDEEHIDTIKESLDCHTVKDADSSQMRAILDARAGKSFVIQGPPGTGKSQTIANIIADSLSQNKSVLFVSEKMAALEVVKKRLDEVHLGDTVLELHSNKSNKVEVLRELSKTLEQGKPKSIAYDNKDASIELMNELNAYCNAVNELIGNSRYSFISAVGKQMQLKRTLGTPPRFQDDSASNWTSAEFSKKMELVTELAVLLPDTGSYQQNPFYGSKLTVFLPFNLETLESDIHRTLETLSAINKLLKDISDSLKLNCPLNKIDAYSICGTAERLSLAPDIKGIKVADNDWLSNSSLISKVISSGISLASIKIRYSSLLTQNFWEQDVQKEYEIFSKYHTKWWRLFSPVYRRSYATLRLICNGTPPKNHEECLKVYEGIIAARQHTLLIAENDSLLCKLFNNYWQGVLSNWDKLTGLLEWILGMHKDVESGLLPENVFQTLDTGIETKNLAKTAELARININTLSDLLKKLTEQLSFIPEGIPGSLFEKSFQELESTLSLWAEQLQKVYSIARLNKMMGELKNSGLSFLAESLFKNEITADKLTPSLEWVYVSALIKRAYSEHPELRDFDSAKHSRRIERFRECDKNILFINQHKLATAAWNKMPGMEQPGQMAIIRHELNKKRKILPIRQLIDQAGEAIRQIKPVFMMSPMSIATFLPPGRISFDVVIFDEASQVKSVDAFGAILRGSQIIVAGDKRQMPPTSFFSREADLEEEENITSDIESILGLFRSRGISERYLRWHYRSRHESLIAVSNVEFYERKLIVFPSAGTSPDAFGLKFNYNPTALFDRGKTRTNREEAKIVAKAIMNHARTRSHLTLGVAAFSVAQRDLIQVELELLRKTDPSVESFFNEHPEEPFFVKNLENIQGDERDVIFISIGYGRNETGKVARNFGPINTTGGERRLNVLITRAKMGLEVFSNFKGDELPVGPEDAHGVRALAHFLKYAETRELDCPEESEREMDSVFEEEVMIALCNKGYQVATQVGTAGYFIDLAIRDPKLPGRFILGIECDGASYHSSKSARDRDRLRQAVLEGLGWRFHRIWSTDWFRNPAGELDRCIVAIQQALESTGNGPVVTNPDTQEKSCTEVLHRTSVVKESVFTPKKYIKAVLPFLRRNDPEIHLAELSELADMIAEVVKTESPVHIEEVTRRLMEVYKISRAGSRVSEAITKAVSYGKRNQLFFKNKDFLYTDNICTASIRDRSEFDTTSRKLEWVAPEEIDSALLKTVELGFSVPAIETLQGAIKFLGFGRMTESMEAMLNKQLKLLIKSGKLNYDGTFVVLGAKDGDAN